MPSVKVAGLSELKKRRAMRVEVNNQPIALFIVDNEIFAIDDTCSHEETSLAGGYVDEESKTIECPLHGSKFSLPDGRVLSLPAVAPVKTYPVTINSNAIYIDI